MTSRFQVLGLGLALLLLVSGRAAAQEPEEEWQAITINGERAGHAHSVRTRRDEDGRALVETRLDSKISLARLGQATEIESSMKVVETEDGQAVSFWSRSAMSAMPTEVEGTIEGDKVRLRKLTGGTERESEQPWDPAIRLSEGTRRLMVEKGFEPGTKYSFATWSFDMARPDQASVEVIGPEEIELDGAKVAAFKLVSRSKATAAMATTSWVDDRGNTLVSEVNVMGMKIRTARTTRAVALGETAEGTKPAEPTRGPEVFLGSMPRSSVILPRPRRVTELVLRLSRDEGFTSWTPPPGLEVLERSERAVKLRVVTRAPAKPARFPAPATPQLAPFLAATSSVQSDDPELSKAAREVAGTEQDMLVAASKLAAWVHEHIASKGFGVGSASAREVFMNKEGDCSEHAVLLAAMLRAAGIPAKVCGGYLYLYGAWGGHAWVSAWVGEWVDLDATLGGAVADAARIKFSESGGEGDDGPLEGMMGVLQMGGVTIDVERFALDGQRAADAAARQMTGRELSVPTLALTLSAPEGWTWAPAAEVPAFAVALLRREGAQVKVSYLDLPTDRAGQGLRELADPKGKRTTIAGRPAVDNGDAVWIEVGAEELLVFHLEGNDARAAFDHLVKGLKK